MIAVSAIMPIASVLIANSAMIQKPIISLAIRHIPKPSVSRLLIAGLV